MWETNMALWTTFRGRASVAQLLAVALVTLLAGVIYLVVGAFQTSDPGFVLLVAVDDHDVQGVKRLLRSGVDPNFRYVGDNRFPVPGTTPLSLSRRKGYRDIERVLLSVGAKQ